MINQLKLMTLGVVLGCAIAVAFVVGFGLGLRSGGESIKLGLAFVSQMFGD